MAYSFHPFPVVSIISAAVMTSALSALVYLLRDFLGDFFMLVLVLMLAIGFLRILNLLVMSQTLSITLSDSGIIYARGIFARKEVVLPYSQVTEASFTQGILQRLLGIANLDIDTPGGANMAIHFSDARYEDVKRVLDRIHAPRR